MSNLVAALDGATARLLRSPIPLAYFVLCLQVACGASDGSSAADSTPAGQCGDTVVDEGESCDDGNDTNGDGCNVDCRQSGELQWCTTLFSFSGWAAETTPKSAALDVGVAVAGHRQENGGVGTLGWVATVDPTGQVTWEVEVSPSGASSFSVTDVTLRGLNIVLAGLVAYDEGALAGWVGEFDGTDGTLLREKTYSGVLLYSVAVGADGLLLAGAADFQAWAATTDDNWDLTWEDHFSYGPLSARALEVDDLGSGKFGLTGTDTMDLVGLDGLNPMQGFYREYQAGLVTLDQTFAHPDTYGPSWKPLAFAPRNGGVLVAGNETSTGLASKPYLWSVSTQVDNVEAHDASSQGYGVLLDLDEREREGFFVVGSTYDTLPASQWVSRLDQQSLNPMWTYDGPPGVFGAVSPSTSEPAIYAVGAEQGSPESASTVVCKFSE